MTQPDQRRILPHVALSRHAHNRLGNQRTDRAWLDERWADPASRVLVVSGTRVRPVDGDVPFVPTSEAPADGVRVLLGSEAGVTYFATLVAPEAAPGAREDWLPLRALLPMLPDRTDLAPLLFHAVGLAEWHHSTRFCPRCGAGLEPRAAGHELRCTGCDRPQFPRTDPAVIMAVVHDDASILLGRQPSWPEGRWSTLAGFCEPGETLEDAVRREVMEEVGIPVGEVTWFGNQPWPLPASLMLGFVARAESKQIDVDGAEIESARWFTREQFRDEAERGLIHVPRGVSISSSLVAHWFGGPLPGEGW
ncbi:NAD(+) diphosphatase [Nocardioides coralli]|uniref:NAD(+) diphosphatase n=1 Tax=Nocardioides coralli TaxID=2872154 RepID=UPI002017190C|nr:NAD(+) diphosphatase [Nocardioides coralli]